MLVLSRHVEEEIVVTVPPSTEPTTFTIKVTRLYSNSPGRTAKVRLGFDAPPAVKFVRAELLPTTNPTPPTQE